MFGTGVISNNNNFQSLQQNNQPAGIFGNASQSNNIFNPTSCYPNSGMQPSTIPQQHQQQNSNIFTNSAQVSQLQVQQNTQLHQNSQVNVIPSFMNQPSSVGNSQNNIFSNSQSIQAHNNHQQHMQSNPQQQTNMNNQFLATQQQQLSSHQQQQQLMNQTKGQIPSHYFGISKQQQLTNQSGGANLPAQLGYQRGEYKKTVSQLPEGQTSSAAGNYLNSSILFCKGYYEKVNSISLRLEDYYLIRTQQVTEIQKEKLAQMININSFNTSFFTLPANFAPPPSISAEKEQNSIANIPPLFQNKNMNNQNIQSNNNNSNNNNNIFNKTNPQQQQNPSVFFNNNNSFNNNNNNNNGAYNNQNQVNSNESINSNNIFQRGNNSQLFGNTGQASQKQNQQFVDQPQNQSGIAGLPQQYSSFQQQNQPQHSLFNKTMNNNNNSQFQFNQQNNQQNPQGQQLHGIQQQQQTQLEAQIPNLPFAMNQQQIHQQQQQQQQQQQSQFNSLCDSANLMVQSNHIIGQNQDSSQQFVLQPQIQQKQAQPQQSKPKNQNPQQQRQNTSEGDPLLGQLLKEAKAFMESIENYSMQEQITQQYTLDQYQQLRNNEEQEKRRVRMEYSMPQMCPEDYAPVFLTRKNQFRPIYVSGPKEYSRFRNPHSSQLFKLTDNSIHSEKSFVQEEKLSGHQLTHNHKLERIQNDFASFSEIKRRKERSHFHFYQKPIQENKALESNLRAELSKVNPLPIIVLALCQTLNGEELLIELKNEIHTDSKIKCIGIQCQNKLIESGKMQEQLKPFFIQIYYQGNLVRNQEDLIPSLFSTTNQHSVPLNCEIVFIYDSHPFMKTSAYIISPSLEELKMKQISELKSISGFSVEGYFGKLEWLDPVDLTDLDIDKTIRIEDQRIYVYPESEFEPQSKPKVGEGINGRCKISYKNASSMQRRSSSVSNQAIYKSIKKQCAAQEVELLEFDETSLTWTILVKHFSCYAFNL